MNSGWTKGAIWFALGVSCLLAFSSVAMAGPGKGKHKAARQWVQAHMELGKHHMLLGEPDKALPHFEAIMSFEPKLPERAKKKAQEAGDGEGKKRGRKRGRGAKLFKVKVQAHLHAAAAYYKMGDAAKAEQIAESALQLAEERGAKRAIKICERFLDEPEDAVERIAPTVGELQERLNTLKQEGK